MSEMEVISQPREGIINNNCNSNSSSSITGHIKRALRRSSANDLLIMLLVVAVHSVRSCAANVMVHSELSDGQFSRWISLDGFKFKETSLTPEAG